MAKVLIVDDSPIVLEETRLTLEEAGHAVITSESALGIGAIVAEEEPDVILLDINMPDVTGIKVLELSGRDDFFKDFFLNARVVLYSDMPEEDLAHLTTRFGAAGYLRKTGDRRRLVQEVEHHLEVSHRQ